ncbi:MAG: MFS transporter [Candidatus Hodarchaeota archaeon]
MRDTLGLEKNIIVMLIAIFVIGMGEEMWVRFIPKYLELLGASTLVIALYGTLKELLDAIYQYPGGWLSDKLGRRLSLGLFTILAIIGYFLYLVSPSWEWVLLGTILVMAWSSLSSPGIFAIIGDNLSQDRRATGFGVQSTLKRVPRVIAPSLGGFLIVYLGFTLGIKIGLAISIVLAFFSMFIVTRHYIEKTPSRESSERIIDIWGAMDGRLKRLLVSDCLARWAGGIPNVFIVLYVLNVLQANALVYGWLIGLQMSIAIFSYIMVARLSDRMNRKPFILLTFAFFAFFPLALVVSSTFLWLVFAFAVAGLREVGEPARKALIVDLVNEKSRGRSVGVYYLMRGLIVFPASILGGVLWLISPELPFYIAFIFGMLGVIVYALWGPGITSPNFRNG